MYYSFFRPKIGGKPKSEGILTVPRARMHRSMSIAACTTLMNGVHSNVYYCQSWWKAPDCFDPPNMSPMCLGVSKGYSKTRPVDFLVVWSHPLVSLVLSVPWCRRCCRCPPRSSSSSFRPRTPSIPSITSSPIIYTMHQRRIIPTDKVPQ